MTRLSTRNTLALTGLLLTGLCVAGCQSDDDASSSGASGASTPSATSSSPTAVADRRISDGEAKAALVTTADLPSGWDQVGTDVTRATLTERILTGSATPASCQPLIDAADPSDTTTLGVAAFRKSVAGPWLAETIASYDDAAAPRLATVTEAAKACPKFTLTASNGDKVDVEVSGVTEGVAGDDSVSFQLSGKRGVVPAVADVVLVARGQTIVGAVGGGVTKLSAGVVENVVQTSTAKLPTS